MMELEHVWIVGCSRCANEGISYEETEAQARVDLMGRGWTSKGRTYCPQCNGELR